MKRIKHETFQKIARANGIKVPGPHRPLTSLERIAVRSASRAICSRLEENDDGTTRSWYEGHLYKLGVLTGLSIGALDWSRDLPGVVERYINRYGCGRILSGSDKRGTGGSEVRSGEELTSPN